MTNFEDSFIPIWKPKNIYSNDIVKIVRKKYNVKAGHAGTLDPFAEGVLIVCTGAKTKEIDKLHLEEKKYLGTIGALSLIKEKDKRPFLLMNGDVVANINFDAHWASIDDKNINTRSQEMIVETKSSPASNDGNTNSLTNTKITQIIAIGKKK